MTLVQTPHPLSADAFEHGVPHEMFEHLRDNDPVQWTEGMDGSSGFWSVTRYDDVVAVTRDPSTFSSQTGGTTTEDISPDDLEARRALIDTDPPEHTDMRKLLANRFTPGAIRKDWTAFVDELVNSTLDNALAMDGLEFVETIASVVPIKVLGALLGVPQGDQRYLMKLGDEMIAGSDPDHAPRTASSPETRMVNSGYPFSSPAGRELWEYADGLRRRRAEDPAHDVFSLLMTGQLNGRELTSRELDNFFSMLVVAGNETTRMALSHGALAFAEHPDQFAKLKANPELIGTAVEEIVRWATPIHHFRRTATRDTDLGGQTIRAGDKVVIWYVSANRDHRVFDDPHRFEIERKPNRHIAFGAGGPHFCLGNSLARLELKSVFGRLARDVERIELNGDVVRLRSNLTHGVKRLPVRFIRPS